MESLNISLPKKLKDSTSLLVELGYFASLSDAVRTALRELLKKTKYDFYANEAKREHLSGKAMVLKEDKEIDDYINSL
ncbi:hypothetical protein OAL67_00165 [bacterium]|nr:hypothetical protein [bacterium]